MGQASNFFVLQPSIPLPKDARPIIRQYLIKYATKMIYFKNDLNTDVKFKFRVMTSDHRLMHVK